jgi:hypothetical protein
MVVAKKCGYCGSYMKAENANNFNSAPDFQEWLESVNSILNPRVNSRLNGDILNEGAIPPQLKKYVLGKKKGKKKSGCGCCEKCKCSEMKMKVMPKMSKKKSKCMSPKMSSKMSPKMSSKMSPKMSSKKSWKKSPKK